MIEYGHEDVPRGHKNVPTLHDWLSYLESLHPKTIALGLERIAQVRQRLNLNPDFPIITVGGTNGKGSVCAMLEAMLHAAGYKVGCYTSPHLLRYNERVRIAKQEVSDAELCASFEKVEQARKGLPPPPCTREGQAVVVKPLKRQQPRTMGRDGVGVEAQESHRVYPHPNLPPARGKELLAESAEVLLTYFEFGTLSAMQIFVEQQVDVAILEVGLGGRLDAVNIFDSDVAVVTSVDLDHMDYLGDTIEKIAYEKAGIFRKDMVAIFGDIDMPEVVANEAQRIGAELWQLGKQFGYKAGEPLLSAGGNAGQWDYRSHLSARNALPMPALRGAYQLNNASAVLVVLDALKEKLPVSMEAVRRGLVEVTLPARFQMLPGKPTLILDVAHNPHAARALAKNLASLPPSPKTYAVCAMLKDKDIAGVIAALNSQVDVWLVAGIDAPRGATADELMQQAAQLQLREVLPFSGIAEALHEACNRAGENDRIIAFGSFYTVAEVMRVRGLRGA